MLKLKDETTKHLGVIGMILKREERRT